MSSDYWLGFALGLAVGMVIMPGGSKAAELRVVSSCRVGTWQMATATDCFNEASRRRSRMVKPGAVRFYCDGRRV